MKPQQACVARKVLRHILYMAGLTQHDLNEAAMNMGSLGCAEAPFQKKQARLASLRNAAYKHWPRLISPAGSPIELSTPAALQQPSCCNWLAAYVYCRCESAGRRTDLQPALPMTFVGGAAGRRGGTPGASRANKNGACATSLTGLHAELQRLAGTFDFVVSSGACHSHSSQGRLLREFARDGQKNVGDPACFCLSACQLMPHAAPVDSQWSLCRCQSMQEGLLLGLCQRRARYSHQFAGRPLKCFAARFDCVTCDSRDGVCSQSILWGSSYFVRLARGLYKGILKDHWRARKGFGSMGDRGVGIVFIFLSLPAPLCLLLSDPLSSLSAPLLYLYLSAHTYTHNLSLSLTFLSRFRFFPKAWRRVLPVVLMRVLARCHGKESSS